MDGQIGGQDRPAGRRVGGDCDGGRISSPGPAHPRMQSTEAVWANPRPGDKSSDRLEWGIEWERGGRGESFLLPLMRLFIAPLNLHVRMALAPAGACFKS